MNFFFFFTPQQHGEIKLKAKTSMLIQQGRHKAQEARLVASARQQVVQGETPSISPPKDFGFVVKKGQEYVSRRDTVVDLSILSSFFGFSPQITHALSHAHLFFFFIFHLFFGFLFCVLCCAHFLSM